MNRMADHVTAAEQAAHELRTRSYEYRDDSRSDVRLANRELAELLDRAASLLNYSAGLVGELVRQQQAEDQRSRHD